jgi:hypothetical protein
VNGTVQQSRPDIRKASLKRKRYRRAARSFGRWIDATGPESRLTVARHFANGRGQDRAVAFLHLCVPKMSSMSCGLRVFMEDATEAIMAPDLELI